MRRKHVIIGISVLIAIGIIVTVCTFGCNYSKLNGGSPALMINSVKAKSGDVDVKVAVEIKNNPGIASITASLQYNTKAIELTDIDYNNKAVKNCSIIPFKKDTNIQRLSFVSNSGNIEGDCTLAVLSFDIKDTADGEHKITLSYNPDDIYDDKENNVEFKVISGIISVEGSVKDGENSQPENSQPSTEKNDYSDNERSDSAETKNTYTVAYYGEKGEKIHEETLKEGEMPNYPNAPYVEGYIFKKWDKTVDKVSDDTEIKAVYEKAENAPEFVINGTDAKSGEKNVAVTISLKNNPGIASVLLNIVYDTDKLKLTDFKYNQEYLSGCSVVPFNASAHSPCLNIINAAQNITGDGVLATLYFDINQNAEGKALVTVDFEEDNVYDIDETNIEFSVSEGFIDV